MFLSRIMILDAANAAGSIFKRPSPPRQGRFSFYFNRRASPSRTRAAICRAFAVAGTICKSTAYETLGIQRTLAR